MDSPDKNIVFATSSFSEENAGHLLADLPEEKSSVLKLFQQITNALFQVSLSYVDFCGEELEKADGGIHKKLWPAFQYARIADMLLSYWQTEGTLAFHIQDYLWQNYLVTLIPNDKGMRCLIFGPYFVELDYRNFFTRVQKRYHFPSKRMELLRVHTSSIPQIEQSIKLWQLLSICYKSLTDADQEPAIHFISFAEGSTPYDFFGETTAQDKSDFHTNLVKEDELKIVEDRYKNEAELLQAVSAGKYTEALRAYNKMKNVTFIRPYTTQEKNLWTLSSLNTLLRKQIESNNIHPYYIDRLSDYFSRKIYQEKPQNLESFSAEMLHAYCELTREKALEGYSLTVQRALLYISQNLHQKFGLAEIADYLEMNPSYLSSLVKEESGKTVTQCIQSMKIKRAKELLRQEKYSIREVALEIGEEDFSYFSKVFKKYVGVTANEYRKTHLQQGLPDKHPE